MAANAEPASSAVLVALVHARGVIDADHVDSLERELFGAAAAGATKLLVDLGQADDVATVGMNALLAARQALLAVGGEIAVVLPFPLLRRFETLGLDRRFLLADDRLQAAQLLGLARGEGEPGTPLRHARAA